MLHLFLCLERAEIQPKEYSLKVSNSRSNAVHCGRCVKYNNARNLPCWVKELLWTKENLLNVGLADK